jgi:hypothetical protein
MIKYSASEKIHPAGTDRHGARGEGLIRGTREPMRVRRYEGLMAMRGDPLSVCDISSTRCASGRSISRPRCASRALPAVTARAALGGRTARERSGAPIE